MIAQLKKGVLEFCVMLVISKNELYGYEIMQRITNAFPDTNESTVYTVLRRLLSDGYTQCYSKEEPSGGPPRKYYRMTVKGTEYLKQSEQDWNTVRSSVEAFM